MASKLVSSPAEPNEAWQDRKRIPSYDDVVALIEEVEALHSHLQAKAKGLRTVQSKRLKSIVRTFAVVKEHIPSPREKWDITDEAKRVEIGDALKDLFNELSSLNQDELHRGRRYFWGFFSLLVILALVYTPWHVLTRFEKVPPGTMINTAKLLRDIESERTHLVKVGAPATQLAAADLEKIIGMMQELQSTTQDLPLSSTVLQLVGAATSEAATGQITETDTLDKLRKATLSELDSLTSTFLWGGRQGRWIEIAWWAEFGTLVGILFYLAGELSIGRFMTEERTMFWAEIVSAPFVVLAIFFLFAFTGITAISSQDASITGTIGLAFIFGFASRRTLGLLDTIKKRLLPEPEPASKPMRPEVSRMRESSAGSSDTSRDRLW